MSEELTDDQIDLLYEQRQMDDAVLVEQETLDDVREILAVPLSESVHNPNEMPIEALAAQYLEDEDEDRASKRLEALSQVPETGESADSDTDDRDDDVPLEALQKLKKAQKLESRLPKRANRLRKEACRLSPGYGTDDADLLESDCREDIKRVRFRS